MTRKSINWCKGIIIIHPKEKINPKDQRYRPPKEVSVSEMMLIGDTEKEMIKNFHPKRIFSIYEDEKKAYIKEFEAGRLHLKELTDVKFLSRQE